MSHQDSTKRFGRFQVSGDRHVIGEVSLSGSQSYAYLSDNTAFDVFWRRDGCILGSLLDFTKVTLVDCIPLEGPTRGMRQGEETCAWRVFPHYVVIGDRHVDPQVPSIFRITLFLEDANALFYDFFAFGSVLDAKPHIASLVKANYKEEEIIVGDEPQIAYFTGKREIIRVDTTLGTLTAEHNPSSGWGGPSGVSIGNAISVSISPESAITFDAAIDRVSDLMRLLELLIGRPQTLKDMWIHIGDGESHQGRLRVHWSFGPERKPDLDTDRFGPHPSDVLIDPVRNATEFSQVVTRWLAMDETHKGARVRFSNGFKKGNQYSIDRLVGAANMFDVLPASATPKEIHLSKELADAKQQCVETFKKLDQSLERNSILGALGRVGHIALKHKVRHRAAIVQAASAKPWANLDVALDEAVNCRNYFVHGTAGKIKYGQNGDHLSFLTDTLEFVFAASELVEAGWDIERWHQQGTTMSHPFGRYRVQYARCIAALQHDLAR